VAGLTSPPHRICLFILREGALRPPPLVGTMAAWTRLRTRLQSRRGVTAAPPWPDLPSSKTTCSGKGLGPCVRRRLSGHRRVGSGRHLRALPRAGSTAARSPSGERRTPVSGPAGGAASPVGWPPAASSLFLGLRTCRRSLGFGGEERRRN
jgi:hypothetical protein